MTQILIETFEYELIPCSAFSAFQAIHISNRAENEKKKILKRKQSPNCDQTTCANAK